MPPTNTDSSVFIRILLGTYGHIRTLCAIIQKHDLGLRPAQDTTPLRSRVRLWPCETRYAAGGSSGCFFD